MKKSVRYILWTAALIFLIGVLVFVNFSKNDPVSSANDSGEKLEDFSITCLNGTDFTLSEQRGKVVVINLWATWCIPCINELPNFDRIQNEYPDEVTVIAIHSAPVTTDVNEWLSDYSYEITFASDEEGEISKKLASSDVLPQTLIIDQAGNVVYTRTGSLTYEELSEAVSGALG